MLQIFLSLTLVFSTSYINASTRSTLDPKPNSRRKNSQQTVLDGLRRYSGQTHFITAEPVTRFRAMTEALESRGTDAPSNMGGGEQREVVDSDIFSAGPEGTKTLILLNGYRGLMILDFSKGPQQPELIGRVPATGNHPYAMYVDWSTRKALVIENWHLDPSNAGARLLIYDLSDLTNPKVIESKQVKGYITDSRLVGDVLYVIGHTSYQSDAKSFAQSFKVSEKGVREVQYHELRYHVDGRENMGIQEVKIKDGYQYYITAITKKTHRQWWWTGRSQVEVLDISSPMGIIVPLMVAEVQGSINKRSWVTIHNHTLFVTSNYRLNEDNWNSPLRVSVESFALPGTGSKFVRAQEMQYRQLSIEHDLEDPDVDKGADAEKWREDALAAKVRGLFAHDDKGAYKPLSDFKPLDFGDTTGQSAQVQDVRYVPDAKGNLRAQVFWVPANMVDPLDLVMLGDGNQRPKHQSRLEFSGWIERSIPIQFQGRDFIIGLGYAIPAVDNRQNRRISQVKVFEVLSNGQFKAVELAQLELNDIAYSNVGGQDKMVSFRFDQKTGAGSLLFQGTKISQKEGYQTGGQIVEFQLPKDEASKTSLTAGSFILGESGWLKRVFMAQNLNAMMTFSDEELGVFAQETREGEKIVDATTRMELARNLIAYHEINGKFGIQIIRNDRYSRSTQISSVEIRTTKVSNPDAEKSGTVSIKINGQYLNHWVDEKSGNILIATVHQTNREHGKWASVYTIQQLKVNGKDFTQVGEVSESVKIDLNTDVTIGGGGQVQQKPRTSTQFHGLVKLNSGKWIFSEGSKLWELKSSARGLELNPLPFSFPKAGFSEIKFQVVDGQLMAFLDRPVDAPSEDLKQDFKFSEFWIADVIQDKEGVLTIDEGSLMNIPGTFQGFVYKSGKRVAVLTKEDRLVNLAESLKEPTINLMSINEKRQTTLQDLMNSHPHLELVRTKDNQWIFTEPAEGSRSRQSSIWGGDYDPRSYEHSFRLGFLDVSEDQTQLHRSITNLNSNVQGYKSRILKISPTENPSILRAVLSTGSVLQVLDIDTYAKTAKALPISPINLFALPATAETRDQTVLQHPGSVLDFWTTNHSPRNSQASLYGNRLVIPLGKYGACEAKLLQPRKKRGKD